MGLQLRLGGVFLWDWVRDGLHSNVLFFFLYFYFYLYHNVWLFFYWVSNYPLVVPASGTGLKMVYIQRDHEEEAEGNGD